MNDLHCNNQGHIQPIVRQTPRAEPETAPGLREPCRSNHKAAWDDGWAQCPACGVDIRPAQPVPPAPQSPAAALRVILLLLGNVDHSAWHGEAAAQIRGELLNDIRELARKALGTSGEAV